MDDLDRLSLAVAMSTLEAESESPGSQKPNHIEIAKQILAQLQQAGLQHVPGGQD
jgi:hypothetical protein